MSDRRFAAGRRLAAALLLAIVTGTVYAPVRRHAFLDYDDPGYVVENPWVHRGLTVPGVAWAFTSRDAANWHPLTWLSHMADVEAFGLDPGPHHLVNVGFHVANATLLLFVLADLTGSLWPSAFAAALFALHPLHVESVAWVSERKDVLSAFWWLATMGLWGRYARRPTAGRYLAALAAFAAGLMAKPMVVTLPFVLLLLDVWPLRRPLSWRRLVAEQVPFLALAAATSAVTVAAQRAGGAVATVATAPISYRIANALNSWVAYLQKTIWPTGLAVFYPYPSGYPAWWIAVCALLLAAVSLTAVYLAPRRPYLLVGWLWYVGTLVPVIELVRAGDQAMADRFTYIPSIGVFIMVAWTLADLCAARPRAVPLVVAAGTLISAALATATALQVGYWRDSITLFEHALAVAPESRVAHTNLATALVDAGRVDEAMPHLTAAVRLEPRLARTHVNLGMALAARGERDAALAEYRTATGLDPDDPMAHYNLGHLFAAEGRLEEATREYGEAVRLDPAYVKARNNLGLALAQQGRLEEAIAQYREAIGLRPDVAAVHGNLAVALEATGRREEAVAEYTETIRLVPDDPHAHFDRGAALSGLGRADEAAAEARALAALAERAAARGAMREAADVSQQAATLARTIGREDLARDLTARQAALAAGAARANAP